MRRTNQLRQQDAVDKRSRWWRDGIVCGCIGAFIGMMFSGMNSVEPAWGIAGWSVGSAVLGAIYGDRFLAWIQWSWY